MRKPADNQTKWKHNIVSENKIWIASFCSPFGVGLRLQILLLPVSFQPI